MEIERKYLVPLKSSIEQKFPVCLDLKIIGEHILATIEKTFMGEKLGKWEENIEIKTPKSWFQQFKKQYFPKILLKKFPVKYEIEIKTIEFDIYKIHNIPISANQTIFCMPNMPKIMEE